MQLSKNYSSNQLERAFAFEKDARLPQAQRLCSAFLRKHPHDRRARYLQAKLHHGNRDLPRAQRLIEALVIDEPKMIEALRLYIHILLDRKENKKALEQTKKLIELDGEKNRNFVLLSHVYSLVGEYDQAMHYLKQANGSGATDVLVDIAEAAVFFGQLNFPMVIRICEKIHEQHGLCKEILEFWGTSLLRLGRSAEALEIYDLARNTVSEDRRLRFEWMYRTMVPTFLETEEEVERYKKRYVEGLRYMRDYENAEAELKADQDILVRRPWDNFYYPYLATNVKDTQQERSDIIRKYVSCLNYELLEFDPTVHRRNRTDKIRIGYVSGHLHSHTVGMYWYGNYMCHDRSKFEIYGYYIGTKPGRLLSDYSDGLDKFVCLNNGEPIKIANMLKKDKLDVIIYPDVGMESVTSLLCVMRLAPIQCVQYGHPITTGAKEIDYFLSGELIEPADCEDHYTETLVRFPNIGLNYLAGLVPDVKGTRKDYDLPENVFLFVSPQSVFKYLPQYDWIYANILSRTDAKLVFISSGEQELTDFFVRRMTKSFAEYDVDFSERCIVLPRIGSLEAYIGFMQCCNFMLDPPMWSGGRTTLEGISQGLPVVTWPGPHMRARVTAGILNMIGFQEAVVDSLHEYVEMAIRAANDHQEYERLTTKMKQNNHKVFEDVGYVRSLETFLEKQVEGYYSNLDKGFEIWD